MDWGFKIHNEMLKNCLYTFQWQIVQKMMKLHAYDVLKKNRKKGDLWFLCFGASHGGQTPFFFGGEVGIKR